MRSNMFNRTYTDSCTLYLTETELMRAEVRDSLQKRGPPFLQSMEKPAVAYLSRNSLMCSEQPYICPVPSHINPPAQAFQVHFFLYPHIRYCFSCQVLVTSYKINTIILSRHLSGNVDRESSVGITAGCGLDGPRIETQWDEILRIRLGRPWGSPSLVHH